MSNSSLVNTTVWCREGNYTKGRDGRKIEMITIHHMAGVLSAEQCGRIFQQAGRGASAHYGIGKDGEVGLYVDEYNTAWANANWDSNCKSVTIETSNSSIGGNYPVSDKVLRKLIELVADISIRNNLGTLVKGKNLTWHSMYANTNCPGDYLRSKMDYIVAEANKIINKNSNNNTTINAKLYKVQVGAFKNRVNAEKLSEELINKGIGTFVTKVNNLYKVQCGAYSNVNNARNMAQKLNNMGYSTYIENLNESKQANKGVAYRVNCEYPNIRSSASLNSSIVRRPKKNDIIYVVGQENGFLKLTDGTYLKIGFADKI